jgi:hypothetical protein
MNSRIQNGLHLTAESNLALTANDFDEAVVDFQFTHLPRTCALFRWCDKAGVSESTRL